MMGGLEVLKRHYQFCTANIHCILIHVLLKLRQMHSLQRQKNSEFSPPVAKLATQLAKIKLRKKFRQIKTAEIKGVTVLMNQINIILVVSWRLKVWVQTQHLLDKMMALLLKTLPSPIFTGVQTFPITAVDWLWGR
jgi:hypothetical protein